MTISSNTLFHFTSKFDHLLNILENNFTPHLALEDFSIIVGGENIGPLEYAIPMVSFCDIPLSQTKDHMLTYGEYGIGLTKEWGRKHGITPVLYVHPQSLLIVCFKKVERKYRIFKDSDDIDEIYMFIKPYKGNLWRSNGIKLNVVFYNEREWRYVPIEHKKFLLKEDFLNSIARNTGNQEMSRTYSIQFVPDDIRYLIVKDDSEILPLIHKLQDIKSKYNPDQRNILTTKIITAERIKEDF